MKSSQAILEYFGVPKSMQITKATIVLEAGHMPVLTAKCLVAGSAEFIEQRFRLVAIDDEPVDEYPDRTESESFARDMAMPPYARVGR